jgi:hypothetical protein
MRPRRLAYFGFIIGLTQESNTFLLQSAPRKGRCAALVSFCKRRFNRGLSFWSDACVFSRTMESRDGISPSTVTGVTRVHA